MCFVPYTSSINVSARYNLSTSRYCHLCSGEHQLSSAAVSNVKGGVINLPCVRRKVFSPEWGLCHVTYVFFSLPLNSVG